MYARQKGHDTHKLWKSILGSDVWELVFSSSYDLVRPFETSSQLAYLNFLKLRHYQS